MCGTNINQTRPIVPPLIGATLHVNLTYSDIVVMDPIVTRQSDSVAELNAVRSAVN